MSEYAARHAALAATVHAQLPGEFADRALRGFDDPARHTWSYLPGERDGVALHSLPRRLQVVVLRLVAGVLRPHAFAQVAAVMALEDVLDRVEGGEGFRHRGDYWLTMFGRPGEESWGWRFEGHHVSLNVTVVGGVVRVLPVFLGANPASVRYDGALVSAPLAPEEQVARALLSALGDDQRRAAVRGPEAPADILSERHVTVSLPEAEGVAAGELAPPAYDLLQRLVHLYLDRVPEEVGAAQLAMLRDGGWQQVRFQWRGSDVPGRPHYYLVTGPRLLVEYDNLDGNHIHTVLRDPAGDFGRDLLAEHRAAQHGGPGTLGS